MAAGRAGAAHFAAFVYKIIIFLSCLLSGKPSSFWCRLWDDEIVSSFLSHKADKEALELHQVREREEVLIVAKCAPERKGQERKIMATSF